ncbi:MAG: autotransporter-associated beta strand repeat-containing protein [Verrucomicrobiota bacterium]
MATPLYWDTNGVATGSADLVTGGTWGVVNFWNTDATGGAGGVFQSNTSLSDVLSFSAGSNATGANLITISGAQSAQGLVFDNGVVTLQGTSSPSLTLGSSGLTMNSTLDGSLTIGASVVNVILAANQSWSNYSSRALTVASKISGSASGGATHTLTVDGTGSGNVTISGVIGDGSGGGALALTKSGAFVVTASGVNTYTGATTITDGTLRAGVPSSAFGANSAVTLGNTAGAVLDLAGFSNQIGSLSGGGGAGGNVTLGAGTLSVGADGTSTTYAGIISGAGGVLKNGAGVLTLSGANTYTGLTSVTAGSLTAGVTTTAFGVNSAISLSNVAGATLNLNGFDNTIGSLAGGGLTGGNVSMGAGNLTVGGDGTTTSYAGIISGAGGVTKVGAGTLRLTGISTFTGNTTISAGFLQIGDGVTDGSIATSAGVVNNASLIVNVIGAQSFGMDMTGAGLLSKVGAGTLTLSGNNTYTGLTKINAGTLSLGSANALNGGGNITFSGGTLQYTASNIADYAAQIVNSASAIHVDTNGQDVSYSGILGSTNTGGLTKWGAGILTLGGVNTYTGTTTINGGTLLAGVATSAFGNSSAVNLGNNSAVLLDLNGFDNTIGSLAGGGTTGGSVALGTAILTMGGNGTTTTFSGLLSGAGGVVKLGAGTQTLTGANTYTGATTISAGSLQLGNGTTDGSVLTSSGIVNNASLVFNLVGNQTDSLVIGGTGTLLKKGAGVLTLTGNNTYTGNTILSVGTLNLGVANALGGGGNIVFSGGTLQFSAANTADYATRIISSASRIALDTNGQDVTFNGVLPSSNTGGLSKVGAGTLTLAAANLYTGATNVIGGTLKAGIVTSAFGASSAVTLSNTAGVLLDISSFNTTIGSLAGGGATGGNVFLGSSTLSLGADGTSTTFSGIISGTGALSKSGAGTQTLSGANTYTGTTTVTAGGIKAGVATSAFGNNSAISLSNVAGVSLDITGFSNTIGSLSGGGSTGGNVVLGAATLTIGGDGSSTTFAGGISGAGGGITKTGAGTLTFSKANTYTGATSVSAGTLIAGVATSAFGSNSAVTLSNVANVTLDITGFNTTIGSLAGGGTTGGSVTLGSATLSMGSNGTSTAFSGVINGAGGVSKSGAGTQTFSGANMYTGATTISAGSLKAGIITNAFGNNSAVTLANTAGVFLDISGFNNTIGSLAGGGATGGTVVLGAATLTIGADGTSTTYSGGISGTGGGITKTGTGTLTLAKANTYTGATTISAGTLKAGVVGTAFGGTSAVTLANAVGVILDITGFNNTIGSLAGGGTTGGSVTLGSATLTLGGDGTSTTFSGLIGGAGGISKSGAGAQTLSGTNTYTGATSITAGSLKAGVATSAFGSNSAVSLTNVAGVLLDLNGFDTTIGSLSGGGTTGGSVALGVGTLTVGGDATNTAFGGVITGAGAVIKTGAGTLTLTGAQTYTGITTINSGTLQIGNGTTDGSIAASSGIVNSGSLIFNLLGTQTDALPISGTGRLTKTGSGTLVLSGSNSYTGITFMGSGVLNVGGVNALAGGGSLTFIGGTLQFSASNTVDYSSRIANSSSAMIVDTNSQSVTFASPLVASNTGGLTKLGAGILTVSGANAYSGATTIIVGTLRAGGGTSAFGSNTSLVLSNVAGVNVDLNGYDNSIGSLAGGGSLGGNVILGTATLTAGGDGTNTVYAGSILGAGGFTKSGTGTLTLTGTASYTGATLISGGTLQIGDGTADGSITTTSGITNNAAFVLNLIGSQTDAMDIGGTGALTKTGVGILTLSGSNSYSGLTIIGSGTLSLGSTNALAGGGGIAFRGGTLQYGPCNAVDYGDRIILSTSSIAIDTNSRDVVFAGSLASSNTAGLSKFGAGTLTLSGSNLYTGPTLVIGGTLKAGVAGNAFGNLSAVTLSNNAGVLLDLAGFNNTIGSLAGGGATGGNVSLGAGTLTFGGDGTSTTFSGVLSGSGGVTKSGAGVQTLSRANTYTGPTTVTAGSLKAGVASTAFGSNSAVTLSNVAGAVLDISGFSNTIGSLSGGGATGGNVILGAATLTVGSDGTSTTFSGGISGAGGAITKAGTGTLTLAKANTYTGATTVTAGTLAAGVATSAFGSNSAVTLSNVAGAVLDITGFNNTIGSLAGGGSTGGNVTLGSATLTLGGDGTSTTFAGIIAGAGGVSKSGVGTQTFSGANTYTGATSITAGTLKAGVATAAFGSNSAVTLSNVSGAVLDITGFDNTIGSLAGGGAAGGNVTLGSATLTLGGDGTSTTFSGVIAGSGAVSKAGAGIQTFSRANTYTGATTISAGTLKAGVATTAVGNNSAVTLSNVAGAVLDITGFNNTIGSLAGGGTAGGNVTLGSATLTLGGDGTSTTFAGVLAGSGGVSKTGAGTQIFSGANTYTGATSVTAGSLKAGVATAAFGNNSAVTLSNVAGVILDITGFDNTIGSLAGGGTTGGNVTLGSATLTLGGDGTSTTFAGIIAGSGGVSKVGGGIQTFSGANTYTGATTITAGSLKAGVVTSAFGNNSAVTLSNVSGANLDITGFNNTIGSLAGGGSTGGNVTLGSATLTLGGNGTSTTFSGAITGSGGVSKTGIGTQIFSGANTYTGATTITAGSLKAGIVTSAFGNNSAVTLSNVAGVMLDITGFNNTVGSLAGGGTAGGNVTLGSATLTLGGDGTSTTYAGVIAGAGGITKNGSGTMTLSGTNLYTGTTLVNAGSLVAGGAGAFAGLGGITLAGGALDLGSQSMSIGGITQTGGSLNLGASYLVSVTGSATLGGTVNVGGTVDFANVGRYTILNAGGVLSGSYTTGALPNSTYYYLNTRGTALDLQRKATVGTLTATAADTSIITGGSTAVSVTVVNNAPALADSLSVALTSTGSLTGSGSASGIAPLATSSGITGLRFSGTAVGAAQSGTVRATGVGTSNSYVDTTVSVNVYDHASTTFTGGTLVLGNMREGYSASVAGSNSLTVSNAAGYRVALMGSAASAGGITLSSLSGIAAANSGSITATLSTGSLAGSLSRSFTYTFADDSSLNGALTNVGTATIYVTGGVYRSAIGSLERSGSALANGATLTLAAVRVGDVFTPLSLDVRNTATSGDSFSEKLNASISSGNGTGSVSLLAAGSLQSGTLGVSVPLGLTGSVGVKTGSVVVDFQTDGTGTSGLTASSIASGTVNLTGTVYRKAVGALASGTLSLGAIREGGTFTTSALTVQNTASSDGFSDDLVAAISTVSSGIVASGTSSAISTGSSNSSSLQVNYSGSSASAGAISGTVGVSYTSRGQTGTGLSDVAPVTASDTVAVSGSIYRLAQGGLSSGTVTFGNIRIGSSFSSGTISVTNTAANDTFSDRLRVFESGNVGGFTIIGGSQTLNAAQSGTFSIGLSASPTAIGTTGGTVSFGLVSLGQTGTGLSDVLLGVQSLNVVVTGNVYRMGSGVLSSGTVTLASVRESDVFVSLPVTLTNATATDGFSEKLNAAFGTLTGSALGSGSVQLLAAGSSNATSLQFGLTNNGSAGLKTGSALVRYETDGNGTSGLASESAGSGTVSVSGAVYRKAVGSVSSGTLVLSPIREGGTFSAKTVTVANTSSTDGYSDDLAAAISVTGTGMVASGSAGLISAGSQNNTAMSVNYTGSTTSAGLVGGTATLAYTSKGQSGTGLSDVAPVVASETVAVSGKIYRLAQGSLSTGTISLGNVRVGGTFGSSSVVVSNTAANDGYSDQLRVGTTGVVSAFTISGGTQTLAASGTGSYTIGFAVSASSAGIISNTLSFGMTSVGQTGTGLSDVSLANQTLNVTGTVYRAGSAVLASNQVTLAGIRESDSFMAGTLGVSNGAATDGFSEKLNVSLGTLTGGAVASGTVQLLAAGTSNLTALQMGLTHNGTAGLKTGSVNVLFQTDGSGTSGLAAASLTSGTVTVSGSVYRKAVGGLSSGTLDLGAIRQNGTFTAKALTVGNTASTDGFSDDLGVTAGTVSSGITVSGSAARISAGSVNSSDVLVNYTGSTASVGVVSGSARVVYTSNGQVGTGLSDVAPVVSTGTVAVSGTVYRLAQGVLGSSTLTLGNIRAGSAFGSGTVQVSNVASNDGFSDLLRVSQAGDTNGFVALGGSQTLAATQSGTFSVGLRASPTAVGTTSGSVVFGLTSVGQTGTGLADVALANETLTVTVTGSVFREASGLLSSSSLSMGNIREGESFTSQTLSVTNTSAADGFSEKLNVSFGTLTGGAVAGGSVQLLAATGTNSTALSVGLSSSGTAGLKRGTARVLYETDGNGTSGIAAESVGGETVSLTGSIYRKAIGAVSSGTLNLGAIRENGAFSAKSITVRNDASGDGFSDDLGATLTTTSTGLAVSSGTGRIVAGSQNSTDFLVNVTGSTAAAGVVSGTASVEYTSRGQVGTGLVDVTPDRLGDEVSVSGTVYRLAQGTLSQGTLDLGRVHAGTVASLGTVQVANTVGNDGFSDSLKLSVNSGSSGFLLAGTSQTLAPAGSASFGVGYNFAANVSGVISGTLSFGMTSIGQAGTGLSDVALAAGTLKVLAQVYTGQGVWAGASSGQWEDVAQWASAGGRPGFDGVLSRGVDSATFTAVNPISVQMPAQLVELSRLQLLGNGGVQLNAPIGGGGTISLSASPQIQASGGSHFVEVPLTLEQTATITVDKGSKLTLAGALGGLGGIRKLGDGTLLLSARNTYTGTTLLNAGRLEIGDGGLPGTGAITVGQGAVLAFHLTADLVLPNTITGAGTVVSLDAPYRVFWNGGSTPAFGTGSLRIAPGETLDFSDELLLEGQILDINAGTLQVKQKRPQVVRNLVTMETSADFSILAGNSLTLKGNVSGDGVLRKRSPGKLVLEAANTYYGGTEVQAGTLQITNSQALGTAGVRIDAPGQLDVNVGSDIQMTVANTVSGLGELIKTGGGTLLLTGTNEQELGTRVKEGVLEVARSESIGKYLTMDGGTLTLSGTQVLTQTTAFASASVVGVAEGGDAELRGTLSGTGDFAKSGSGILGITGVGAFLGRAVVQQGTLKVTRSDTLSKVGTLVVGNAGADPSTSRLDVSGLAGGLNLGAAQTIKGRGVVFGKVGLIGSKIAPGNSIDTLHFQGDLTLTNTNYEVEYSFANGGTSDRIVVSAGAGMLGKVALNGGLVVLKPMSHSDLGSHRFTILTSAAGIEGHFLGIAPSAGIRSKLIYGDVGGPVLSIILEIQRISYESLGAYGNLREIGRGLDGLVVAPGSAFESLLTRMDAISTETGVRAVLSELNPVVFTELYQVGLLRLEDLQKPISDRLNNVGAASVARGRSEVLSASAGGGSEWSAWSNGFAGSGNVEANLTSGFTGLSRNEVGDVTGVERRFGRLTLGLVGATSFGSTHLSGPDSSIHSDSWHLGGYVSLPIGGGVFADASALFGDVSNEVKRTQNLPTGTVQSRTTIHGNEWMLQAGGGIQLAGTASTWSLMPTVRLAYAGVRQGTLKEQGAGAYGVDADAIQNGTVLLKTSLEGSKEWKLRGRPLRLSGNVEWLHDFDVDPRRTGFRWQGAPGSEWGLSSAGGKADGVKLGMALELAVTDRRTLRLYGEREFLQRGAQLHLGFSVSVGF